MNYELSEGESVAEGVVFAVAAAEGCEPTELPLLTDTLDPDALEDLFARAADGPQANIVLSIVYSDSQITIKDTESIEVSSIPVA